MCWFRSNTTIIFVSVEEVLDFFKKQADCRIDRGVFGMDPVRFSHLVKEMVYFENYRKKSKRWNREKNYLAWTRVDNDKSLIVAFMKNGKLRHALLVLDGTGKWELIGIGGGESRYFK